MESLPTDHPAQLDLNFILEDAERCRDIVKGLLDYSRQSEFQVEQGELTQLVEEAFNLIRDHTLFMNVQVERNYPTSPSRCSATRSRSASGVHQSFDERVDAMDGKGVLRSPPAGMRRAGLLPPSATPGRASTRKTWTRCSIPFSPPRK
jgi:two-component system NtrC family sensor kinase